MNPVKPARRIKSDGRVICSHCRKANCVPGKPRCRAMRMIKANQRKCWCTAPLGFPHRIGSVGFCNKHPNHAVHMWNELDREIRK